jgi:hypothetical protein
MMYAIDELLDQIAYISAVFHWSYDSVLDLEHPDRLRFFELAQRTLSEEEA